MKQILSLSLFSAVLFTTSCKKDSVTIDPYTVPATYDFDNTSYSEATTRVNMWSGLTSYIGKATSRKLSQDTATYIWNNTNSAFTAEIVVNLPNDKDALNSSSLNLSGKVADAALFKALIDSLVKVSESNTAAASEGVPGKVGTRLVNYTGLEFNQAVAKGLMGSLQMANIIDCLNKVTAADNNIVTPGTGTTMQHNWDLAFGYASLPKTYDTSIDYASTVIDRPLALGDYFWERGRYLKAGGKIFEAFRTGRAAIGAKDYAVRDKAIATIKEYLEKTLAAACYDYAGIGMTSGDLAGRLHGLSEGYGFALALKYRQAGSKLTDASYLALLNIFKTSFYELDADASHTKLKQAQGILTAAYGQLQP